MSRFKDWCNKNQGYLNFWTLVLGFIGIMISIILSSNSTFNAKGVLEFLGYKVTIPVYILILSIILIIIAYYLITKKRIIDPWQREFCFNSDDTTVFEGSPTFKELPKRTPSEICDRSFWISQSKKFPVLINGHWISHTLLISDKEAIEGGLYVFTKEFELRVPGKNIKSAYLHCLVDDYLKLFVNGNLVYNLQGLEKSSSYSTLHTYDIKQYLTKGINNLKFEIENVNFHSQMKPNLPFFQSKEKGNLNPYGIIYSVKIIFNEPST